MANKHDKLKSDIIQGFGTLIVREFFIKIFSFVGQVILARILAPEDFGTYVIIVFIIGFFNLFSDIGLSQAIVQKKTHPSQKELSAIFWLKILLSLILIILIYFSSFYIRNFYPSLTFENSIMIWFFSATILLTNIRSIPISLLERDLKYNLISWIDIVGIVVYYVVALLFALFHFGVWSLVIGVLVKEIIETIIIYTISPFIPQFIIVIREVRKMLQFGLYLQGNNIVSYFINSINPIVGGIYKGPYGVGLLDFAGSLISIPSVISINFGRVSFAGYSRMQDNKALTMKAIHKSIKILAIILYYFPVIILCFGGEIVSFIYTSKWLPAIPLLYWLSFNVFFYPHITASGQVLLSIGKSKHIFWANFIICIIAFILAYFLNLEYGLVGIAITNVIIYVGYYFFYNIILQKVGYEIKTFTILLPALYATIIAFLAGCILNVFFIHDLLNLIIKLFLTTIIYFGSVFYFSRSEADELLTLILSFIKGRIRK